MLSPIAQAEPCRFLSTRLGLSEETCFCGKLLQVVWYLDRESCKFNWILQHKESDHGTGTVH